MVHKKYIKKDGKVFGPYFYENKRVNGKVITTYLGIAEDRFYEKNKKLFLLSGIFIIFLVILLLFFIFSSQLTGRVSLDVKSKYKMGEVLSGKLKFNLKQGELIPKDSKIVISLGNEVKEFNLNELIDANLVSGEFFVENLPISGSGEGYGLIGEEKSYPTVIFDLKIYNAGDKVKEEVKENVSSEEEKVSEAPEEGEIQGESKKEESKESIQSSVETNSNSGDSASADVISSSSSESSDSNEGNEESAITGSAIAENEIIISGSASKGNDFIYNLENGQKAAIATDSVKVNENAISEENVRLNIKDNKAVVSTEYSIVEEGFGEEYLGNKSFILEIDLDKFGFVVNDNTKLNVKLVYDDAVIVEVQKDISIEEIGEGNETLINVTIENETLINESAINVSEINVSKLSFISDIPNIRIAKNSYAEIDLSEHFIGAERYGFIGANISAEFDGDLIRLAPDLEFIGARKGKIFAYARNDTIESNEFNILVSSGNFRISTLREKIVVGEPVKWKKIVSLDVPENVVIQLEKGAENVSVKKITDNAEENATASLVTGMASANINFGNPDKEIGIVKLLKSIFAGITGRTVSEINETIDETVEVVLGDNATQYVIEYYTAAPQAFEEETKNGKKVIISAPDELNYEDVIASTKLDNKISLENSDKIKVYWYNYDTNDKNVEIKNVDEVEDEEIIEEISNFVNENIDNSLENDLIVNNTDNNETEFGNSSIQVITGAVISQIEKENNDLSEDVLNESKISIDLENKSEVVGDKMAYLRQEIPFDAYDMDEDGRIDYIEWVVPHLSNQTFEIILITKAEHLNSNRTFIEDIYEQVRARDNNWSAPIPSGHYVRATFEINLSSNKDITLYARSNVSNTSVEVYEKDGNDLIAKFDDIGEDKAYKVLLTNLGREQDTFDLRIIGEEESFVEFDWIVDPTNINICQSLGTANTVYQLTANVQSDSTCFTITADNITLDLASFNVTYNNASGSSGIYGVLVSGANYSTIRNGRINQSVAGTSNFGIYLKAAYNGTIYNMTFIDVAGAGSYAINLEKSGHTVFNNIINISSSGVVGIFLTSSNFNNITHNNITTIKASDEDAIFLSTSHYNNITGNFINTHGAGSEGISFSGSWNNTLTNNTVRTNGSDANALLFAGSSSLNSFYDSFFNGSHVSANDTAFATGSSGIINFTNITLMNNKTRFSGTTTAKLNVHWYLTAQVNDSLNNQSNNANVTAYNASHGRTAFSVLTGSDGFIARQEVLDYWKNASVTSYQNNYTFNVTKSDYFPLSRSFNVSQNLFINFSINDIPNITINSPLNYTNITDLPLLLNWSVADRNNYSEIFVWASNNTVNLEDHLVYHRIQQKNDTYTLNWSAPIIEKGQSTVLILHFDNLTMLKNENETNALDFAHFDNNATLENGLWNSTGGIFAGAFELDGRVGGRNISVADSNVLDVGNFTISLWLIKRGNGTATGFGIIKVAPIIAKGFDDDPLNFVLGINSSNNIQAELEEDGTLNNFATNSSNTNVTNNEWYNIVFTHNTSTSIIYIDGNESGRRKGNVVAGTNTRKIGIGQAYNVNTPIGAFNGSIDEVVIWNRTLSASEVFDLFRHPLGKKYWRVNVSDNIPNNSSGMTSNGIFEFNFTNFVPNNPTPVIRDVQGDLGFSFNVTNTDLNCSSNISDPDGDSINVSIRWYNKSVFHLHKDYNNSYANATKFFAVLDNGNTTKNENWSCAIRIFDSISYSNWVNSSRNMTILNSRPTLSLIAPQTNASTTNRTPTFTWSSLDNDNDVLSYEINLSCRYGPGGTCSSGNRYINNNSLNSTTSFIPVKFLEFLADNDYFYNWTMRAYDGQEFGNWAAARNFSIQSQISISLPVASVNFSSINNSDSKNTSGNNPQPIVLQNDGNTLLNISINFTSLFSSTPSPTNNFQYMIRNTTKNCFISSGTQTTFTQAPKTTTLAIREFNFTAGYQPDCNNVSVDFLVTVPADELPGNKSSLVAFTASLGEPGLGSF